MIKADCALCLKPNVDLLNSHYIPKGLYKVLRKPLLKNPNPVRVSRSMALLTTEQTSDYLLCAECEKRFNLNGEKWVISRVWRDKRTSRCDRRFSAPARNIRIQTFISSKAQRLQGSKRIGSRISRRVCSGAERFTSGRSKVKSTTS